MYYENTVTGTFLSRPNRFIAHVEIHGQETVVHVKNTGRCKELLVPGATVVLEKASNPARKTPYDLIAVYKGDRLINMDSQAPNKVFGEWAAESGFFGVPALIKPESFFGSSRFDFYIETEGRKIFVEVKGVTLERDGVVLFPDAPTLRGTRHLRELAEAVKEGYEAYVFFVIQMEDCLYFVPNAETDPAFASVLQEAAGQGVQVKCLSCQVEENSLRAYQFVPVRM